MNSTIATVGSSLLQLHQAAMEHVPLASSSDNTPWSPIAKSFLDHVQLKCSMAYDAENGNIYLKAFHAVNHLSMKDFVAYMETPHTFFSGCTSIACHLLNPILTPLALSVKSNYNTYIYEAKWKCLVKYTKIHARNSLEEKHVESIDFLATCMNALGMTHHLKKFECNANKVFPGRIVFVHDEMKQRRLPFEFYIPRGNQANESYRLSTFIKFKDDFPVNPVLLAAAGFFYTGYKDKVKCFSCHRDTAGWMLGDDVTAARWHAGDCLMALKRECGNIPKGTQAHDAGLILEEQAPIQDSISVQEPPDPSESEQRDLMSMFQCLYPVSPHMRSEDNRFETFDRRWPSNRIRATARQVASAGFFYLGERDRVKCWYCNGGLENWEPDDEPWSEHAKWFPVCEFILQHKGHRFVSNIIKEFPNFNRPVLGQHPNVVFQRNQVQEISKFLERLPLNKQDVTMHQSCANDCTIAGESPKEMSNLVTSLLDTGTTPSMEARIRELQDERMCKICLDKLADIVFMPCGHLCSCTNCARSLRTCPTCRVGILTCINTST